MEASERPHTLLLLLRPRRRVGPSGFVGQQGSALLSLLPFILLGGIMGTAFYTLVIGTTSIETSRHMQHQVYWLARGKANAVLHQMQTQNKLPITRQKEVFANGIVDTTVTKDTLWHVLVTATGHAGGTDTIYFSIDPTTRRLTEWVDHSRVQ